MLRVSEAELLRMDERRPGIREQVLSFEAVSLPGCPCCGSQDTASVQVGAVGRLIEICYATSKVTMVANGPRPGKLRCNSCSTYFE